MFIVTIKVQMLESKNNTLLNTVTVPTQNHLRTVATNSTVNYTVQIAILQPRYNT